MQYNIDEYECVGKAPCNFLPARIGNEMIIRDGAKFSPQGRSVQYSYNNVLVVQGLHYISLHFLLANPSVNLAFV